MHISTEKEHISILKVHISTEKLHISTDKVHISTEKVHSTFWKGTTMTDFIADAATVILCLIFQIVSELLICRTDWITKWSLKKLPHMPHVSFITHRLIAFKILEAFNQAIDMNQKRHTVTKCDMRPMRGPEKLARGAHH